MTLDERIQAYLDKIPPCIAGQGGDTHLFKVACTLWNGFALSEADTRRWLGVFNEKCEPPWDDYRLDYKASAAANASHQKPRGHLLGSGGLSYSKASETSDRYTKTPSEPTEVFQITPRKSPDDPDASKSIYRSKSKSIPTPSPIPAGEILDLSRKSYFGSSETSGNVKTIRTIPAPKTDLFAVWYMNDRFDETAHWHAYGQLCQVGKIFIPHQNDQSTIFDQDDPDFVSSMIEYRAWLKNQPSKPSDHHTQRTGTTPGFTSRRDAAKMERGAP
jgi:hypothetical protein